MALDGWGTGNIEKRRRRRVQFVLYACALLAAAGCGVPAVALAESASDPGSLAAGQIDAGRHHTCAILSDGTVRCWGYGADGRNTDELRCWGYGFNGQLGYGDASSIGDTETPGSAGPVNLGPGRTAVAAGSGPTCAILDDGAVRCWGAGLRGQLGYGNTSGLGNLSTPDQVLPVRIGAGRKAEALGAALSETCVLLDDGTVRCWGAGEGGRLGYGNTVSIGDTESPDAVAPVNLGAGRGALALALGDRHTCARLDDGEIRCWGYGANGRLGYCNETNIGDDETPGSTGPVGTGDPLSAAPACPRLPVRRATTPQPGPRPTADPSLTGEKARAAAYRRCTARAARHARREIRSVRRLPVRRRAKARRHVDSHRRQLKRACARRHGRTPGRVTGLTARASGRSRIVLTFRAAGTDGSKLPPARTYVVKQSGRPRRGANGLRRTKTLCGGRCRFSSVIEIGATLSLTGRGRQEPRRAARTWPGRGSAAARRAGCVRRWRAPQGQPI